MDTTGGRYVGLYVGGGLGLVPKVLEETVEPMMLEPLLLLSTGGK